MDMGFRGCSVALICQVDYHKLYHETILPAVKSLDKTRDFISSSPSNGIICQEPFTERYKVDHPRLWGDTHYYNYLDDGTDPTKYPLCRFASGRSKAGRS